MKIIIVGTAYPYRGGLSAFNERLAYQYLHDGHEVEIYTFSLQYPSFLFPGKTQYSDEPAPEGLSIHRRVNSINPFNWIGVGREIARKRPDILITKYWLPFMAPCLGTIERIVRRNKHTRIVSILDNVIPHEHRIGDKLFSRYFVRSTDAFVAMSRSVLNDLALFDTQKPRRFCPHPLYDHYGDLMDKQEARKLLSLDPDGRYILFFGFIRSYKGLDLLLDAMADMRLKELNVKLIVAGEFYGDPKPYMEQIERLDIAERIVLCTDFIPDSKVNRYFRACDIVAQPYKSATQSGVTQIAFHFEKPMLVTNVGGLAEIVPDGVVGYVVEPVATQIADALVRYYVENKEETFTTAVKEEKKKYSWDKMVEAIGG
jgi:glycosyltransferase involved in cell wall biosynthesis